MAATRMVLASLVGLLFTSAAIGAPVGWRTDGTGCYPDGDPPIQWAEDKNVLWKTKLPGHSFGSPILIGDRIFVVSDPAELICVDAADGKILWQRSHTLQDLYSPDQAKKITTEFDRLKAEKRRLQKEYDLAKDDKEKREELKKQLEAVAKEIREQATQYAPPIENHGSGNSAATPTSDGKLVYALFGNGIIGAYTFAGERQWIKYVEASTIGFGHASSPVLVDDKILVHLNDLVALDRTTGEPVWRVALPARHATPAVMKVGTTQVVVSPAGAVIRLADGKVLLKTDALTSSECSPILRDGVVYTFSGRARAVRFALDGDDGVKLEKVWEAKIAGDRRTPSAVLHDGLIYAVTTNGMLDVLDASTGEQVYQQRLQIGEIYASAAVAGEHLFISGTKGATAVLEPGRNYRQVTRNQLEGFGSCPIFAGQKMFVRTNKHLYCIGK